MSTHPVAHVNRLRLGEILVELGHLNEGQLGQIIQRQRQAGGSLGRAVLASGLCTEKALFSALAFQAVLPLLDLDRMTQESGVIGMLPEKFSRENRVVALSFKNQELTIAMTAPASLTSQDLVRAVTGRSRLRVVIATDAAMQRALDRFHGSVPQKPEADRTPKATPPRHELFDSIGLSVRAGEMVRRVAVLNNLSSREVLQRVLETWAQNTLGSRAASST
jgi:hypothetical protein